MEAAEMAARLGRGVLTDIQATVPLEPRTAARAAKALAIASSDQRKAERGKVNA